MAALVRHASCWLLLHHTKNFTGNFTTEAVRSIQAFYYAVCWNRCHARFVVNPTNSFDWSLMGGEILNSLSSHFHFHHILCSVLQDVHAGRQLPCSLAGHGVQGWSLASLPVFLVDRYPTLLGEDWKASIHSPECCFGKTWSISGLWVSFQWNGLE